jgi:hypothetical protein
MNRCEQQVATTTSGVSAQKPAATLDDCHLALQLEAEHHEERP